MRHRVKGRNLSRSKSHRLATLRSLSTALLKHKKIMTTVAKAKETRKFVEPLITKAKENSVHSRRLVGRQIKDKDAINSLFGEIVEKIGDRPGGYTRIVKVGNRNGDAAEMALLELVDYNEVAAAKKTKKTKKAAAPVVAKKEAPAEEVKDEDVQDAEVIEEETEEAKDEVSEPEVKEEKKEEPASEEPKTEVKAEKISEEAKSEKKPSDEKTENDDKKEEKK